MHIILLQIRFHNMNELYILNLLESFFVTLLCSIFITSLSLPFPFLLSFYIMERYTLRNCPLMKVYHYKTSCKVKVNLSLCLFKHHTMKTYWGCGGTAPHILNLGTRWGEWSASWTGSFNPGVRAPGTHWIGGWVDPRFGLDAVAKRKKIPLVPLTKTEPRSSRSYYLVYTEPSGLRKLSGKHDYFFSLQNLAYWKTNVAENPLFLFL
jgi:hypothetical protein